MRWLPAALILSLSTPAAGCAAVNTLLGREKATAQDAGLRERGTQKHELQAGANLFRCTVLYEAGEHETWSFDDAFHCPPDLTEGKAHAEDDRDLADPVRPVGGAPEVAVAVPDWCDAYDGWGRGKTWTSHYAMPRLEAATTSLELLEYARYVAVSACDRQHYRPRQQWVASWLQAWVNTTGMDVGTTKVLLLELVQREDAIAKAREIGCTRGPLVSALTCPEPALPSAGELDALEVAGTLDDSMRIAYLAGCRGAACSIDAAAVEWDRAPALVAAGTDLALLRFIARAALRRLADVHAASSPDAERAAAAYRAWKDAVPQDDPRLRPAYAVVTAAAGGQAAPACPEGLDAALTARLRAGPTAKVADLEAKLHDPWTQLLFRAATLCDRGERPEAHASLWASALLRSGPAWLGPRRSALVELGGAVDPLPPLRADAPSVDEAVVAKVEPQGGDALLVRLEGAQWTEPVERCWETRRIHSIDSDGTINYRTECKTVGKLRIETVPDPLLLRRADGATLAKGRTIGYHADRTIGAFTERRNGAVTQEGGGPRSATLVTVHDGERLLHWLGFDLGG